MYTIKQSTAITVPFFVHDVNGDAVTGLLDASFTKRISKNGAAFGAMTVTISEMENGWYSIPLSTSHSDTLGLLSITFTNAGAKQVNLQWRVEARLADDLAFPTVSGRSTDTTTGGANGVDWGNVENQGTAVDLALTDIQLADTVGSVSGAVGSVTGNVGGNVVGSVASVSGNVDGNVTGSVGSVTGAVASVTGNVGGNVVGSVASVTGAVASVTADVTVGTIQSAALTTIRDVILPEPNVALSNIAFLLVAASDGQTPVTAATGFVAEVNIDGAGFVVAGGSETEIGDGLYIFDATASDMNGGIITFRFSATGGTPGAPLARLLTIATGSGV